MKKKDYKTVTETTTEHMQKLNAFFFSFLFSIFYFNFRFHFDDLVFVCMFFVVVVFSNSLQWMYLSLGVWVCVYDTLMHFYLMVNLGRTNWNRCKIPKYEVDLSGTATTRNSIRQTFIFLGHLFCHAFIKGFNGFRCTHHDAQRGTMKKGQKKPFKPRIVMNIVCVSMCAYINSSKEIEHLWKNKCQTPYNQMHWIWSWFAMQYTLPYKQQQKRENPTRKLAVKKIRTNKHNNNGIEWQIKAK